MCFGSKVDTSVQDKQLAEAQAARQQEEARQAQIKQGTADVNNKFGQFDDSYFGNFKKNYTDYYQPQLDTQFSKARDNLTYALSNAGLLNSSVAGTKMADLTRGYDDNRASLMSKAAAATDAQRSTVNNTKSSLIAQLNSTGDAGAAADMATNQTKQIYNQMPAYDAMGDIFSGAASGIGSYLGGQNYGNYLNAAGLPNVRRTAASIIKGA